MEEKELIIRTIDTLNRVLATYSNLKLSTEKISSKIEELISKIN